MTITAVLVHGAFADGSVWNKVTPLLLKARLEVIVVQNALESLAGDVAATQRAIDRASGPVVLVGHSWGGVVITDAGASDKVKSLVYVAAFAPKPNQSIVDIVEGDEPTPGVKSFTPDAQGYIGLPREAVMKYLVPDIDEAEAKLIYTNQAPINRSALSTAVSAAAWENKPSFYAVSKNDLMTPTQLQLDTAKQIGATVAELDSGHVSPLSQPEGVAELIIKAAQ